MDFKLKKYDIIWGYIAQFFSVASGIITLPIILNMLTVNEIGLYYLMLTISSLVIIFDFGFAPQIGRNITYVFSGAQKLKKEGVQTEKGKAINFHLLANVIRTAIFVYRRLSIIVLVFLLTIGTLYTYTVTEGFSTVKNSLGVWVLYSISVFFSVYYSYYSSLLIGKGLIKESRKATVISKSVYIILTFVLLYSGLGLVGVAISNLLSQFVLRYICYHYFFTRELNEQISKQEISKQEKIDLFKTIWHNAKKLGLVFVGAYAISKLGFFLSGLFLSLSDVASYGLMIQLVGFLVAISSTLLSLNQPRFSSLRVQGEKDVLIKEFASNTILYYIIYLLGTIFLMIFGNFALDIIGSNASLPSSSILLLFLIVSFLEGNHSNYANLITTNNNIPFVNSSLIAGVAIGIGSFIVLRYTELGVLGLILTQGVVQVVYANWKWPYYVYKEFNQNLLSFHLIGMNELTRKIKCLRWHQ
jgi:O-antigen/teichoic acid export membrane protein